MSAHTFESILFVIVATVIVCVVIGIGALINHHLVMRRLNRLNLRSQLIPVHSRPIRHFDLN